jgi:hypothetical protein
MPRTLVSRAIRQAVRLHLSFAAPALLACGGATVPGQGGSEGNDAAAADAGAADAATADAATADVGADSPARCSVTSTTPLPIYTGSCPSTVFPFNGTSEECAADGNIPCATLCPSGADLGGTAITCSLQTYQGVQELWCSYTTMCMEGRRPEGLSPPRATRTLRRARPVGRYFAQAAHLEAASVHAFERLARELAAHRAPRALKDAARRAARDEVRHARVMTALAEREGAGVPAVRVAARDVRRLEAIAIENVVEGCVRETFGAAVAVVQAARAGDAAVRDVMRGIARDETRHAELSWALAGWLEARLDAAARARVQAAKRRAVRALVRSAGHAPDGELASAVGLPSACEARRIARALAATLWA